MGDNEQDRERTGDVPPEDEAMEPAGFNTGKVGGFLVVVILATLGLLYFRFGGMRMTIEQELKFSADWLLLMAVPLWGLFLLILLLELRRARAAGAPAADQDETAAEEPEPAAAADETPLAPDEDEGEDEEEDPGDGIGLPPMKDDEPDKASGSA